MLQIFRVFRVFRSLKENCKLANEGCPVFNCIVKVPNSIGHLQPHAVLFQRFQNRDLGR